MTKLRRLKNEARESAYSREHPLGNFQTDDATTATAECPECGAYVQVRTDPRPNEIEIGGNAVAVNCVKRGRP